MLDLEKKSYHSYDDLIDSMEVDRLVEVTDNDYQGDTRLLLWKDDKYGFLAFGWGSCSGCDALEAAADYEGYDAVVSLRDELWESVTWFDSKEDALSYFQSKDWDLDYWHGEEQKRFVTESIEALSS